MSDGGYTLGPAPLMIGAVILALVVCAYRARKGNSHARVAAIGAFVVYVAGVLAMTVFPLHFGRPAFSMAADPLWRDSVNLVPFRTITLYLRSLLLDAQLSRPQLAAIARANLLGNLALLAPVGLLAPAVWPHVRRWWRVAMLGVVAATSIEALQFARRFVLGMAGRSIDIDDVLLNAVGALLGYAVFIIVRRMSDCSVKAG